MIYNFGISHFSSETHSKDVNHFAYKSSKPSPFQLSIHCHRSVQTTTIPLALLCSNDQSDEEGFLRGPWKDVVIPIHSSLALLPCTKLSEESVGNSVFIVSLKPALGKTVILHLSLKKSVHPFPLKPTAVHFRSDQDTHTVQDAVLELALTRKN